MNRAMTVVVDRALVAFPQATSLELRLYGSWEYKNGRETPFGTEISNAAHDVAYRRGSTYITATSVRNLAVENEGGGGPSLRPFLARTNCRCNSGARINEQKLADTMIVIDAVYFAAFPDYGVIVVSDDIDMTPGLLMAEYEKSSRSLPRNHVAWLCPTTSTSYQRQRMQAYVSMI